MQTNTTYTDAPYAIELRSVTKEFPGVIANKNINLQVRAREVHSIVGENGAGKSTLMNMIFGLLSPTSGEILLKGKPVHFTSPVQAIEHGLGMVHQHFMLVQNFSILKNIILGSEPGGKIRIDYKAARGEVLRISEQYGLKIDPDAIVADTSVPMQQRVEIIKVLWRKAEIIIFDEPTAVLTPQEIEEFCQLVLRLKEQGKTILFISHKLAEVMRISDRITTIRRGEVVDTCEVADTNERDLAQKMVGHKIQLGGGERRDFASDKPILDMKGICYSKNNVQKLQDIHLAVMPGEILGIAGVDGNGQEELVDIICGKLRPDAGTVTLDNYDTTTGSIREIKEQGLATVYEDRHKDGLVMSFTVKENLILGYQTKPEYLTNIFFLNQKAIQAQTVQLRDQFDIRCASLEVLASTLSGGNQQKIILAREVHAAPRLLMTVQPTRGLDMGAIEFVHNKLVEQRNAGRGVLFFSLELDEILQVSDRIAVIFGGRIIKILKNEGLSKTQVGNYMLGITEEGCADEFV